MGDRLSVAMQDLAKLREVAGDRRVIVALAGPPGAGKSTFAEKLAAAGDAVHVPLDGFHLANRELERLGRTNRKGAPDTFDRESFVALLTLLRTDGHETVWAPSFDRSLEDPVAGAIAIRPRDRVVVVEGNYLLLWPEVRPLVDAAWYLALDPLKRVGRLIARHVATGKTETEATRWVLRSDEVNAATVEATRHLADRVFEM